MLALLMACSGSAPDDVHVEDPTEPAGDTAPPDDTEPVPKDTAEPEDTAEPADTAEPEDTAEPIDDTPRILMFVAHDAVWWAEYKVMYEALLAAGYVVEVRSSGTTDAGSYQSDGSILASANSLSGSSYTDFAAQYLAQLGASWSSDWDEPATIPLDGRIQDVADMSGYLALVAPGGTGASSYRLDGTYSALGDSDAAAVQDAAEHLAGLIADALDRDLPVLTQCHGAALTAYVRQPGTTGEGFDGLGESILSGQPATGYPLGSETAEIYDSLNVTYSSEHPLVITHPVGSERWRVITSRDWYPQTVLHAALSLHTMLQSTTADQSVRALILHGGPVNLKDCAASNRTTNDIPCNYGTTPASVIPADYTHLSALLSEDSIAVEDIDLMDSPPFDASDTADISSTLADYDVVVFYKHWATGMTTAIEDALIGFADDGGGLIAIHHGLYNDGGAKDRLVEAFGAGSAEQGWSARAPSPFTLTSSAHGHFITTHGVTWPDTDPADDTALNPHPDGVPALTLTDEVYGNTVFEDDIVFGTGVGEITPLLANDVTGWPEQTATAGFARRIDPSGDGTVGRLVYLQPGERQENYAADSALGQMIQNAVRWAAAE